MRDRLPVMPYRPALLAVAFAQLGVTLQALAAPHAFYDDFPLGRGWVAAYPEYNEHLIYDYGAFTLGGLLALVIAAVWLDRRVVQVAIVSWLAGAVVHLTYHAVTIDRFGAADAAGNLIGLAIYVALPGWLVLKSRERSNDAHPAT